MALPHRVLLMFRRDLALTTLINLWMKFLSIRVIMNLNLQTETYKKMISSFSLNQINFFLSSHPLNLQKFQPQVLLDSHHPQASPESSRLPRCSEKQERTQLPCPAIIFTDILIVPCSNVFKSGISLLPCPARRKSNFFFLTL